MMVEGNRELYDDSWYDQNKTFRAMIKHGYTPIIKPIKRGGRAIGGRKPESCGILLIN